MVIPKSVLELIVCVTFSYLFGVAGGGFAAWKYQSHKYEAKIVAMEKEQQRVLNDYMVQTQKTITALNKSSQESQTKNSVELQKKNEVIRHETNRIINGIRSGNIRLRDPYAGSTVANRKPNSKTNSGVKSASDSTSGSATGELSSETSENLVKLAEDADKGNEALKSCIKQYTDMQEIINNVK